MAIDRVWETVRPSLIGWPWRLLNEPITRNGPALAAGPFGGAIPISPTPFQKCELVDEESGLRMVNSIGTVGVGEFLMRSSRHDDDVPFSTVSRSIVGVDGFALPLMSAFGHRYVTLQPLVEVATPALTAGGVLITMLGPVGLESPPPPPHAAASRPTAIAARRPILRVIAIIESRSRCRSSRYHIQHS